MFLTDTNTVIHFLKGAGRVAEHWLETSPQEIAVPSIVLYELEVGMGASAQSERRRTLLDRLVASASVIPFDVGAAKESAAVALALGKRGNSIGPLDTLIAGMAIARGAILVTHNTKVFTRVPGLRQVDWY